MTSLFGKHTSQDVRYTSYLEQIERQVELNISGYRDHISRTLFPADRLSEIISDMRPELFCRLPEHKDFLTLNLGSAAAQVPLDIEYPSLGYQEKASTLRRFQKKIDRRLSGEDDPHLPFGLSLAEHSPLSLAADGMDEAGFMKCVNALIMDTATFQSAEELALCIISPRPELLWTRFLPQVWQGKRRLFHLGSESEEVLQPLLQKAFGNADRHLVTFLDADYAPRSTPLLYTMFNSDTLPEHVHVVFFSSNGVVPSRARDSVLYCSDGCRYDHYRIAPGAMTVGECTTLARLLFNTKLVDSHQETVGEIPHFLTFYQMFHINRAQDLPAQLEPDRAAMIQDSFPVQIGIGSGGRPVYLDLTNDHDGNHCLVTGTNGSGKSEFVQNYLLSACTLYPPDYLSFVVIDFKGRAMSQKVSQLPHCLGEFYNSSESMSGHDVSRIACLLKAELFHRQKIMADFQNRSGSNSLTEYHRRYAQGLEHEPLPRLLVVVDEVAEFFTNDPQAKVDITHIATAGRSVGMVLLLSTQTSETVSTSQITTNINVYLRFDGGTGDRKDNHIKGRAFIDSTAKTNCVCQCALADTPVPTSMPLSLLTASGFPRRVTTLDKSSQLDAVRTQICHRFSTFAGRPSILTEPLQAAYPLQDILNRCSDSLQEGIGFPVAVVDYIQDCRRGDTYLNFVPGQYNLALYGAHFSGKTTAVRTILLSSMGHLGFGPHQLAVYIASSYPEEYEDFRDFPQLGHIAPASQIYYLLLFLSRECHRRKKDPRLAQRSIIAVFDECLEHVFQDVTLKHMFISVAALAPNFNISLVAALTAPPQFREFRELFQRFMLFHTDNADIFYQFQLSNKKEASHDSAARKSAIQNLPNLPGRGLSIDPSREPVEIQIALPDSDVKGEALTTAAYWASHGPANVASNRMPVMPPELPPVPISAGTNMIPVGLHRDLTPAGWDLTRRRSYLISYFESMEMMPFFNYMILALLQADFNLILVDNREKQMAGFQHLVSRYFAFDQGKELFQLLSAPMTSKRRTVLVMLEHAQSLFPHGMPNNDDNELIARIVELLQSQNEPLFYGVFAQSNTYMGNTYNSTHRIGEFLESRGDGILIGKAPEDHFVVTHFGSPNPYSLQNLPAFVTESSGWGYDLNTDYGDRYVKLYRR